MKIRSFIFLFLLICLTQACVSKKKFKALTAQKSSVDTQLRNSKANEANLQAKVDSLEMFATTLLADTVRLSSEKNLCQTQLDSINQVLKERQEMLELCTVNLENFKSKSSKEVQGLIESMEQLQQDLISREEKMKELQNLLDDRDRKVNDLQLKISKALNQYTELGLSISIQNGRLYVSLSNQLLFALGSTEIDKKGKEALMELAKVLNAQENISILVEGHTDDIPVTNLGENIHDNWDLSVLRATEVIRYLVKDGKMNPKNIIASGRGQHFPIAEGKSSENRAKNRRTEIIIVPNLDQLFNSIENQKFVKVPDIKKEIEEVSKKETPKIEPKKENKPKKEVKKPK